jgi:hypothetical protein
MKKGLPLLRKTKESQNKKIKNATPLTVDGIRFKSRLELYTYNRLKESNIKFKYEEYSFVLLEKFDFNSKSMELYKSKSQKIFNWQKPQIRSISYKPDFVNLRDGWIIECKGFANDTFNNKWKMFKKYLNDNGLIVDLFLPRNQKHVDIVIEYIKENY